MTSFKLFADVTSCLFVGYISSVVSKSMLFIHTNIKYKINKTMIQFPRNLFNYTTCNQKNYKYSI